METPLRVCIDTRLVSGGPGGVEQTVIGLASGLSKLTDGDEEYLFLTYADADDWIRPYVQGPCRLLEGPAAPRQQRWKQRLGSTLPILRQSWHTLRPLLARWSMSLNLSNSIPRSDGRIERALIDVMHFTTQGAFLTDVPSIYSPHDLQHLHFPQFFTPWERMYRELTYRAFCAQARMVVAMSSWGKRDLIEHYGLLPEKIAVVPWAPVLSAYTRVCHYDFTLLRKKFNLPEAFIFYPAQTYPHKNHLVLLDALALLHDKFGLTVPLVSSGRLNNFFPTIKKRVRELRLTDQVRFLDFVSPAELQCLYILCRCVVFPTKFEGFGMPLVEAFLAGAPIASSNFPVLAEQAGDAALLFEPDKPKAILRLWTDESLRKTLIERGQKRVARFSWERTARIFRAHYRRLANRRLSDEDQVLVQARPSP